MSGTSGLDFSSIAGELGYWLAHVTSAFKGGFPGSGENGYDFGMPEGTPVYAILPGKVVGVGSYGGGGVVSVEYNSQNVIYYQHLRQNQAQVGDQVAVGQQIGLSGGLHNTDGSPVSCCSSYAHIEVGDNAPFGGIWNPNNVKPNIDPISLFTSLLADYKSHDVPTGGTNSGGAGGGTVSGLVGGSSTLSDTSSSGHCFSLGIGPKICIPDAIYNWLTQPIRLVKFFTGVSLIFIAAAMFIVPLAGKVAGPVTEVAGVASGQPEVVAAGAALSTLSGSKAHTGVTVTKPATPRRAPATQPLQAAPPTTPIDLQPPVKNKLGRTPNPMTAEEIARAQGKGMAAASTAPPTPPALKVGPEPQRAPPTGLRAGPADTYILGARRLLSREPIPDAEVIQTANAIHRVNTFDVRSYMAYLQGQKEIREQAKKRAGMTYEDTRKELGIGGAGGRVPGTEVTLESEEAQLRSLQSLLKVTQQTEAAGHEVDPKVQEGIERDIKAVEARIKKLKEGK